MEKLFSGFKNTSAADWKQQIIKDLKGTEFEKLIWHNPNGFDVSPFYTAEDLVGKPQPLFHHTDWEICAEIFVDDEKEANTSALKALTRGASGLRFLITKKTDLSILLNEISVEHIALDLLLKENVPGVINEYNAYLKGKNISSEKINGGIFSDPVGKMAGEITGDNFYVDASVYQNAGATQNFELACTLAHAHEYLACGKHDIKKPMRFTVAVGSDLFGEIAKLRALRKLWPLIAGQYNANRELVLHCETTLLNKSSLDAYNNMLRTTTEGISAVIGGCNSLTINPYTSGFDPNGYRDANDFSERIARNQQLIFKGESYLDKVADMGAGSYYIEKLTDDIAAKAWEEFKAIESKGGFIACMRSDYIPGKIEHQATELIKKFQEEKIVLVGVNKFQNKNEKLEAKSHPDSYRESEVKSLLPPLRLDNHLIKQNA